MEALQLARRRCAQVNRVRMFGTAPTAITPRTFIKVIISEGAVKGERIRRAARFAMRGSGSIGLQQDFVFTGYGTICITRLLPAESQSLFLPRRATQLRTARRIAWENHE